MAGVRGFLADHKLGVTIVTASLVLLGGVAVANSADGAATVTAIVDGDTIDVQVDGEEQRVRLLNVDTPEIGECLYDDATAFLEQRIPPGTEVRLRYDEERHDRYGRVLAGVFEDGSLVNEEIARNGLGVAVLFEPNERYYDDVLEAQQEAEDEGLGLFSDQTSCTLPAQVREYREQVEHLEGQVGDGTLEEIDGWADEAAAAAAIGLALAQLLDGDDSVFPLLAYAGPRWALGEDVDAYNARIADVEEDIVAARGAEEERLAQEEAERLAQEEAERLAREEAERLAQEEAERLAREEAERQERAEAERQAAERQAAARAEEERQRESSSSGSGSSSGSSGGGSVYYKNCTAARNAGAAPVYVGQPGYARHLDRDGDGIGCE